MNYNQVANILETELNSWWPGAGNTPIAWENIPFNGNSDTYIAPQVVLADSVEIEFGSCGKVEVVGNFTVNVFGNINSGRNVVMTKADLINNHFSRTNFSGVSMSAGRIIKNGIVENKYQVTIIIPISVIQEARS